MKDLNRYIVVGLSVLGVFVYVLYSSPAPVNWSKTYARTDKIPYGTYIVQHELAALYGGIHVVPHRKRIYNTITELGDVSDTYVLVAPRLDIDEPDYLKMVGFVKTGGDVLIASNDFGRLIADSLGIRNGGFLGGDKTNMEIRFTNPNLNPNKTYRFGDRVSANHFVQLDTVHTTVLALDGQGNPVFVRYAIGSGNIYLLASPDYLTNYAMLTADGHEFAATTLSYITPEHQVIWDDYQTLGDIGQHSPMHVFLNDEHLRPAYLTALLTLLLYVCYSVKRKQRIIPVMEPLKNTSIEFAKVVSSVYYQQHDNRDILSKQYAYFLEHVRTAYRITGPETNESFVQQLIARSGVSQSTVEPIITGMKIVATTDKVDDHSLIVYNRQLTDFYQQTSWKKTSNNELT